MTNDLIEVRISTYGLFHDWADDELHNIDKTRSAQDYACRAEDMLSRNFPYADVTVSVQDKPFDTPTHFFHVSKVVLMHPTIQRVVSGPSRNGHGPVDTLHGVLTTVRDDYMWLSMGW